VPNLITVQLIERGGVVHCIWTTDLRGGRMLGCAKLCSLIIRSKLYTIVSAEYQIFSLKHLIFTVSQRKEKEVDIIVAPTGTKAFSYSRDGGRGYFNSDPERHSIFSQKVHRLESTSLIKTSPRTIKPCSYHFERPSRLKAISVSQPNFLNHLIWLNRHKQDPDSAVGW
jgi:hypothetical protein